MSVYADYIENSGRRFARRVAAISEGVAMAVKVNEELRVNMDPSYKPAPQMVYLVWVGDALHGIFGTMDAAEQAKHRFTGEFEHVWIDTQDVR